MKALGLFINPGVFLDFSGLLEPFQKSFRRNSERTKDFRPRVKYFVADVQE
jgi:hypothetical protein